MTNEQLQRRRELAAKVAAYLRGAVTDGEWDLSTEHFSQCAGFDICDELEKEGALTFNPKEI